MKPYIKLSAGKITFALASIAVAFYLLTVSIQLGRILFGMSSSPLLGVFGLFFAAREGAVPTWYSGVILLFCAALLAVISAVARNFEGRDHLYWVGMSVVFVYLSADEVSEIHERLLPLGRFMLDIVGLPATGALRSSWIVPAMLVVLVVSLVYLRFFFRLPRRTRLLSLIAAVIFIGGAVGMEMVAALHLASPEELQSASPAERAVQIMLPNTEELLEMLGVVVFAYALMDYMRSQVDEIKVRVE